MTTLLQWGDPTRLHSGGTSRFKIDCDALTTMDGVAAALVLADLVSPFGRVETVPGTGLAVEWMADALQRLSTSGRVLIVDDVLTTGASMEAQRAGRDAIGVVLFARGPVPAWVTPLFTLTTAKGDQGGS